MNHDNPFVKPQITDVQLVQPQRGADGGVAVVVLERIDPSRVPDYCVHGKATCHWCDEWCWLGDQTHDEVASGRAAPMCLQCAARVLAPDGLQPTSRLHDHRRADGPH